MRVAVAIPCFDEAPTIEKVVSGFRDSLPDADIIVFDNGSTDGSAELARKAGARVCLERRRGKGYVIRRIFESVDADICVLVDGDGTYLVEDVHALLKPLVDGEADMVVGNRLARASRDALADFRRCGNLIFLGLMNRLTRQSFQDVLSGYRAVNRKFLNTVSLRSKGFEIETELTLRAAKSGLVIRQVPIRYCERPPGSHSKLSPIRDGFRILMMIGRIFVLERVFGPLPNRAR